MSASHEADLSRLLAGELDADEAAALQQRIRDEPEVAAAWEALRGLDAALADLPAEEPVPPGLDAAVLAAHAEREGSVVGEARGDGRTWRWGLGLAAALLLGVGLGVGGATLVGGEEAVEAAPEVHLAEGVHRVKGDGVVLLAGEARIEVRGEAIVRVDGEPDGGAARRRGQEEAMDATHVLSAAGGAVVTLTIVSGLALVWPDGAAPEEPVTLEAGEERSFGGGVGVDEPGEAQVVDRSDVPPEAPARSGDGSTPEQLAARVEALEFENALLRGQIETLGGGTIAFPDGLTGPHTAQTFPDVATAALEGREGLVSMETDCEEFPCLLIARFDRGLEQGEQLDMTRALRRGLGVDGDGEGLRTSVALAEADDGDRTTTTAVFAVVPEEHADDAVDVRLNQRTRAVMEEERAAREASGAGGDEGRQIEDVEDVEVGG